jgi:predicted ABC-type ATPase
MNFEIFAAISRNAAELIRNENNKIARLSEDKAVKLQRAIRRFSIDQSNIPPVFEELPEVNIVVGPSASGKSTLVQSLINSIDGEQIKYIPHLEYSHSVVEDGVCLCEKEEVVIFESILCSKEQRERFMEIKNAGLYVRMFFISTEDPFINVLRGTKQTLLKGKKCDTKHICERYYKSLAAAIALSPYVNELCVFDNSIDNRAPELVLQMDGERTILYRSRNIPEWALLFINSNNPIYNETTPR